MTLRIQLLSRSSGYAIKLLAVWPCDAHVRLSRSVVNDQCLCELQVTTVVKGFESSITTFGLHAISPGYETPFLGRPSQITFQLLRHQLRMRDAETKIALRIVEYEEIIFATRFPGLVCRTITWKLKDIYIGVSACAVHTEALVTLNVAESESVAAPFDSPALIGSLVISTRKMSNLFLVIHARTVYTNA